MPYLRVSLSQKLTSEKAEELYRELSEAFEVLPGKTRDGVVLDLEDAKTMFLRGVLQENLVFADIHYVGNFAYNLKSKFTETVFAVFARVLGTKKDEASLTITEHQCWGIRGELRDKLYSDV